MVRSRCAVCLYDGILPTPHEQWRQIKEHRCPWQCHCIRSLVIMSYMSFDEDHVPIINCISESWESQKQSAFESKLSHRSCSGRWHTNEHMQNIYFHGIYCFILGGRQKTYFSSRYVPLSVLFVFPMVRFFQFQKRERLIIKAAVVRLASRLL